KRKAPAILTPHPGEMAALIGGTTEQVQKNRELTAKEAADLWGVIVVLKGFRTLIAFPDGRLYVNPTGNPGMATAGTGDVLAGMIGGLLAQGCPPEKAALAGVYLHGLAGDMAAAAMGQKGLIASDVLGYVPKAIREISCHHGVQLSS
ncbi:MAG: ADP/ATP-dependent (S)-NAD(P)H-hydrate dehydratase, partial [bacterium]|nr:ADP/ATP-dependent (S)-NAD(P)H-hydrate dehydratase [bacterium]